MSYVFQLVVTPPLVSTGTFILVLRMLAQLCARSPSIAVKLLEQNIVGTLSSLLLGSSNSGADVVSDEVGLVVSSIEAQFLFTITTSYNCSKWLLIVGYVL